MGVRSFPAPRHANRGDGWCTWCGEAVQRPARTWHKACFREYQLHTFPEVQRAAVIERDGAWCWECDESPTKWLRTLQAWRIGGPPEYVGLYCDLRRVCALELEHEVPLWKVAHLPDAERRPFFGIGNLRMRCPTCHKAKSKREAAERAAMRKAPDPGEIGGLVQARRGGRGSPAG